jgi:hypothetical protein
MSLAARGLAAVTLAALAALLAGCRGGHGGGSGDGAAAAREQRGPAAADDGAPPATRGYVLISIDTLRADHLGCYGYARPTSPFLDQLARRATLFEEAYAQFPSTLVSHMSIFTGLHPREHGVLPPNSVLSPAIETLPEVFQRAGFSTGGFTEGGFVSGRFGFRRGFDVFVSRDRNRDRPVEGTFRRAADFLAGLGPRQRFFAFIHTYAVHTPYDAPARFREPFWHGAPPPEAIPATGPALVRANLSGERPPPAVIDWLEALYDAGIRQTDEVLRWFFSELDRLGLARDTTVIVTADHGEEFLEHGLFTHTQLYRETLHVPLLVIHPRAPAAVRHGGVAQLIDIAPTLYGLARLRPRGRPSGRSLAPLIGRAAPPPGTGTGSAWAESLDGVRAVYRGERRRLESLLVAAPDASAWFPLRLAFDVPGGALGFQVRSFAEPHRLVVRRGNEVLARIALTPAWAPVHVETGAAGRLVLEADDCTIPPEDEDAREPQCWAFQLKGVRPTRIEYYDVTRDPAQQHDLAAGSGSAPRRLLAELLAFRPQPRAGGAPRTAPLDPELRQSLRALGYLR